MTEVTRTDDGRHGGRAIPGASQAVWDELDRATRGPS
jgi:hypothetical protein